MFMVMIGMSSGLIFVLSAETKLWTNNVENSNVSIRMIFSHMFVVGFDALCQYRMAALTAVVFAFIMRLVWCM
jgi:hypothetical protein